MLFNHSFWGEINAFKSHQSLGHLVHTVKESAINARSAASNKKYRLYFDKFISWCNKFKFKSLPASVSNVALCFGSLIQQLVSNSVLDAYFYSINWFHKVALVANPCESVLLPLILEGGKRFLCKPVNKKEPITVDILGKIVDFFGSDTNNGSHLRTCAMCLLGFSGFFRYNELSHIQMKDITFHDSYVEIFIRQSKTDVYRRGNSIVIAGTSNKLCPVSWLKRYIEAVDLIYGSDQFVFRNIVYFKNSNRYLICNLNKPLSYSRARELLLTTLHDIGLDASKFSLHSLRSGGATAASNANVSDRLIKAHGRWKSDLSKDGYVKVSLEHKLLVSLNLGL